MRDEPDHEISADRLPFRPHEVLLDRLPPEDRGRVLDRLATLGRELRRDAEGDEPEN